MIDVPFWILHPDWAALSVPKCGCSSLKRVAMTSLGMEIENVHELTMQVHPSARPHLRPQPPEDDRPRFVFYRDPVDRLASVYENKVARGVDPLWDWCSAETMPPGDFINFAILQVSNDPESWAQVELHLRPQAYWWRVARKWNAEFLPMSELSRCVGGVTENFTGSSWRDLWTPGQAELIREIYEMDLVKF